MTSFFGIDKIIILVGVSLLVFLSWFYLFYVDYPFTKVLMSSLNSEMIQWGYQEFFITLSMWFIMMTAMMLPSAMPMIFIFSTVNKKRAQYGNEFVQTWIFLSGYLFVWFLFSILTASLQWLLLNFALLSDELKIINPFFAGIVLIIAGIYQFSPVKENCLKNCQTPFNFIIGNWRYGKRGAFIMGLKHGLYCMSCCWALMLLLFIVGIMNIIWITFIALFILIEKVIVKGKWISYLSGVCLIIFGILIISIH